MSFRYVPEYTCDRCPEKAIVPPDSGIPGGWNVQFVHSACCHYCPKCSAARKIPALRPWKRGEVPMAALRYKGNDGGWWLVTRVSETGVHTSRGSFLTFAQLLDESEWSKTPNVPDSWLPCGVKE